MGEPITDPLILQQIQRQEAKGVGLEPITDPMVLQQIREKERPRTGGETLKDVGRQFATGVPRGIVETAMLPARLANLATQTLAPETEFAKRSAERFQQAGQQLQDIGLAPEAETTAGRYAGAVGEALGGTAIPSGLVLQAARRLPAVASAAPGFAERMLRSVKAAPGTAAALDAASATGAGLAQQGAQEAGLPPWMQIGAGIAGGFAAPLGAATTTRGLRALEGTGAFLPGGETGAFRFRPAAPANAAASALDPRVEARAYQTIADQALRKGMTPDEVERRLANLDWARDFHEGSLAPRTATMADIDEAFARQVGSAARLYPEASGIARPIITARQTGVTPLNPTEARTVAEAGIRTKPLMNIDQPPAGQHADILEAHKRALNIYDSKFHGHGETAAETASKIIADQKARSDPLYKNVRTLGDAVDLKQEKGVIDAFDKWKTIVADPELSPEVKNALKNALRQFGPSGEISSHIKNVDIGKRTVDDQISRFLEKGSGQKNSRYIAGQLTEMKNDIIGAIDKVETNGLGAKYKEARDIFSSDAESLRDLRLGHDIFHGEADIADYRKLASPEAQKRARHGYHSAFAEDIADVKPHIDITGGLTTQRKQETLGKMVPRTETEKLRKPAMEVDPATGELRPKAYADLPERFGGYVQGKQAEIQTRDIVKGGSPTAERLADDAAYDVLHSISDITKGLKGGGLEIAKRGLEYTLHKMLGIPADVAASATRKLMSTDPAVQARIVAEMRLRMGASRFARFQQVMAESARRSAVGTAGGLSSTIVPERD